MTTGLLFIDVRNDKNNIELDLFGVEVPIGFGCTMLLANNGFYKARR